MTCRLRFTNTEDEDEDEEDAEDADEEGRVMVGGERMPRRRLVNHRLHLSRVRVWCITSNGASSCKGVEVRVVCTRSTLPVCTHQASVSLRVTFF